MYSILLVEDNLLLLRVLPLLLKQKGFSVETAATAKEALESLKINNYDLILMDVGLPDMSGIELTKIIRKKHGDRLLIAALTAHNEEEMFQACLDAGMNYAMGKPLDDEKISKLEWLLKNRN